MSSEVRCGIMVAMACAALTWTRASRAQDGPWSYHARGGLAFGWTPGKSSLMIGIHAGGGPSYESLRLGADGILALGGGAGGRGFSVFAGGFGSLGIRGPMEPITAVADLHLGPAWFTSQGKGTFASDGWFGGASAGAAGMDPTARVGFYLALSGWLSLAEPRAAPLFVRLGAMRL